jgi:hypothetical protein
VQKGCVFAGEKIVALKPWRQGRQWTQGLGNIQHGASGYYQRIDLNEQILCSLGGDKGREYQTPTSSIERAKVSVVIG